MINNGLIVNCNLTAFMSFHTDHECVSLQRARNLERTWKTVQLSLDFLSFNPIRTG